MRLVDKLRVGYLWSLFGGALLLLGVFACTLIGEKKSAKTASAQVHAAVDGPYTANNGYDYYVVKSSVPSEDTGEEVCAAVGMGCLGYTSYDTSVCMQVHPAATDNGTTEVSGSKAGFYCDGPPQGGVCSGLTDTCAACSTCNVGVSCFEPIGGLYREMYVQCSGTLGTAAFSAPSRPDDIGGDTDFVVTTLTDSVYFNNHGVFHDIFSLSGASVMFDDGYTDDTATASAFSSLDGNVFGVHGHNNAGTGGEEKYIAKVDTDGVIIWDNLFSDYSFYYGVNSVYDMVDDQNGGVWVMLGEGDVFAAPDIRPGIYHFDSGGNNVFTETGYQTSTNVGRMIPDGSGGVYVISDFGYDSTFSATGPGYIDHITTSGYDAGYNFGQGYQEVVSGGADVSYLEAIPDGSGGIVVLWIGDTSGTFGLHAQHIESDGSIDSDFSSTGNLIYADSSAYGQIQATRAGSHIYAVYQSTAGIVTSEFFLDGTSSWLCRQSIPSGYNYNIINPFFSNPILMWQDTYGSGDAIFAQTYEAGTGHSGWSIGGEVVDASDNYSSGSTLGVNLGTNPALAGFGELSGGVEIAYTYDDGVGVPATAIFIDQSSFSSGPGGDCTAVRMPEAISPAEPVTRTDTVYLSARYQDVSSTPGTTEYRVSSSSLADCVNGVNIVASDTSDTTVTADEATNVQISGLSNGNTYYWCARNDNGTDQSAWAQMYSITMSITTPNLDYLSYLGGSSVDTAADIATEAGIVYITGETNSLDFPTSSGAYDEAVDSNDVYVAALVFDGTGSSDLQWLTVYGGSADESFPQMDVSTTGVYVVGLTGSSDSPTTVGAYDTSYNLSIDVFLAIISLDGSSLDYGTFIGGSSFETDTDVAVGPTDDAFVVLATQSSGFPTTVGAYDTMYGGARDMAVVRLSPDGAGSTDLLYSSFVGTTALDNSTGLAVEGGHFFVSGVTASAAFPTTAGAYDTSDNAGQEGVIFRLNPAASGSADLVYSTYLGGSGDDSPQGIAVESGILYVVGETNSSDFPTTSGAYQELDPGGFNSKPFAAVVNPAGSGSSDLQYSTYLAGVNDSHSLFAVTVDSGIMYAGGFTNANDFPITGDAFDPEFNDTSTGADGVLMIIDPSGNGFSDVVYSTYVGTNDGDEVFNGVAFDYPYFYFAGEDLATYPLAFALGANAYQEVIAGSREAYFGRINVSGGTPTPDAPEPYYPEDGATRQNGIRLSARYSHLTLVGTTDYRVSTGSASNCLNGISIVDSGTSPTTATTDEPTFFEVGATLANGTYYWCARNDDGANQSPWTTMGAFFRDSTTPWLNYVSYLGGSGTDQIDSVFVDGGPLFLYGDTTSADFPTTVGVYDTSLNGSSDVFVSSVSLDGAGSTDLQFSTYLGGTSGESTSSNRRSLFYDGASVYFVGVTSSSDFPTTSGAYDTALAGTADAFIAQLSADGTTLEYGTYLGGTGSIDNPNAGIILESGLAYVAGSTNSSNFPTSLGAYDTSYNGGSLDFFVAKLDLAGSGSSDFLYGSYLGSSGQDTGAAFDVFGDTFYIGGNIGGATGYPTTAGAYSTTYAAGGFSVIEPNGGGSADLIYSSFITGTLDMQAIRFDSGGNIYTVGGTLSNTFPATGGAYDTTRNGYDTYLAVFDPAGAGAADLQYATFLGGTGADQPRDAVVVSGQAYIVGRTDSTDYPTVDGFGTVNASGEDLFVALINPASGGSADLVYSTLYGADGVQEAGEDIAIDGQVVYVSGYTFASATRELFADAGTPYDTSENGGKDGLFLRLDFAGAPTPPDAPTLIFPDDAGVRAGLIQLSAMYSHPFTNGFTDYRLSSSSGADCLSNTNIVDSGSSATTSSTEAPTYFTTTLLGDGTYYWCARNNTGSLQSAWTTMGSVVKDHTAPFLNYASYLGGSGADEITGAEFNGSTLYIVGSAYSSNLPTTVGAYDSTLGGSSDIFVGGVQFNGSGTSDLQFLTYIGGSNFEASEQPHLAVDGSSVYVVGTTESSDFPTTGGAYDTVFNGSNDWIAFKMNNTGTTLLYSTYLGGTGYDEKATSVAVDSGIMYIGGSARTGFPTTVGAYDTSFNGGTTDLMLIKLDPAGGGSGDLQYATYIGGTCAETYLDIAVVSGIVYYIGDSCSTGFPTTVGAYDTSNSPVSTDFVVGRFNPAGGGSSDLQYSSFIGSSGAGISDEIQQSGRMTVDTATGIIYAFGRSPNSGGTDFPTTAGAFQTTITGSTAPVMFVFDTSISGSGALLYSTFINPSSTNFTHDIVYNNGLVYVMGQSSSNTDVLTAATAYGNTNNASDSNDAFLYVIDPAGNGAADLQYGTLFGVKRNYEAFIAGAFNGTELYIAGRVQEATFGADGGQLDVFADGNTPYDSTFNGGSSDALLARFDFAGAAAPANSSPTAPTTLFSNNSNAQFGAANPTGITSATPVFSAICNDPDSGDILDMYRIQVSTVNNFASTVWDSGAAGTSMTSCIAGARSQNITFGGAALAQDGTTYYWRIKFWDDEPSEGVFSETISTNTFTMATSGGGGGGGSSVQRLQTLNSIAAPTIGPVTVLSPSSVRFQWSYGDTSNILGFRLINDANQVATQQPSPTALAADEENLAHNTLVSGRKVTAYNNSGESAPSATYPDAYTFMIPVNPKLVLREADKISVAINEAPNNITAGQSGIQFELISVNTTSAADVIQSPWLQAGEYEFSGTDSTTSYLLRSRGRNFNAIETVWSNTITIPGGDIVPPEPSLAVGLMVTASDGQSLDQALNPNSVLSVEMTVNNNGEGTAESVMLTLPIPDFISYIPGTVSVDGRKQSDGGDADTGQAGNGAVSAVFDELEFGFGHTVRFDLGFDTPRLIQEFVDETKREEVGISQQIISRDVVAQALAAANPTITLQAQASHSGDPAPVFSQPEQVEPDLAVLTPPAPAPAPTPVPTPQQVQIIQNVLQQEFPQPGVQSSQPPIPQGNTTSDTNGGNFSVNTSSGNNQLNLSGTARTNDDQIEFTGTTSEPFAVVTLIFNDSVTAIAVSDANGNWRTFVSAAELGIAEGEERTVRIEAIAAKDDLRSERVQVAELLLSRARNGQIVADFDTLVSEQGFISTIREAAAVIEKQEPAIQTTLAVSAPVLVASSVPLWGYLPYVPTLIYHFMGWLLSFLGRRKKKDEEQATFGVVYDAITKLPLPLAIVRIYSKTDNKLVSTTVTDKLGRYDVLLAPGEYKVEVNKPQYQFPSSIVTSTVDGSFNRVYQDATGATIAPQAQALPHIPVDPINVKRQWELSFGVRKVWLAFQRLGNHLATPIMIVGFVTAIALVAAIPSRAANWVILGLYTLTLASQLKLRPKLLKAWGVVYDLATDAILPLVTIQLIEPVGSKVVTSRLTDYEGRFTFLPEPGTYIVKASKPGFEQVTEVVQGYSDRQPIPQQVHIEKPNQRIAGDIAMKQA